MARGVSTEGTRDSTRGPNLGSMPEMSPLSLPPEEDEIGGVSSKDLFGAVVEYEYSTGRRYRLTFDTDDHVTFEWINQPPLAEGAVFPPQTLSYRARQLRSDQFLVHWLNKQFKIHVSLVIDLAENTINVAAMMPPNSWEYWDTARIVSVTRG